MTELLQRFGYPVALMRSSDTVLEPLGSPLAVPVPVLPQ